jgi:single-strand DNA-binding protein
MNVFTAIATVVNKPELRYTSNNQTPIATLKLTIKEYGEGEITIDANAWGKFGEEAASTWGPGTVLIVGGALNVIQSEKNGLKTSNPCLNISSAQILTTEAVPFCQVVIAGNVGQDVDARHFESGKNNAKTSLAVRRSAKDTDWFALEAWGKTAVTMDQYVTKGSKIGVVGSLKIETWTDKATQVERSKPVIKVDRIEFLGSKREEGYVESRVTSDDF